jgi:outer membrane protein assembly factor BamD
MLISSQLSGLLKVPYFLPHVASLLICIVLGCLTSGCATKEVDPTAGMSPEKIYADAKEDASAGAYDKAIKLFDKVEGRAAGTPLAQQAQIDKAFAHYKNQEPAQAIATLDRFIKLNPASPALDYALYLKGLVNFNDNLGIFSKITQQDLSERDQKAAKESFDAFKELLARFPESKYAPDAQLRMGYIINSLAQYEVHVARYYFNRGAFLAAVNRTQQVLADYPGAPANEDALFVLMKSYEALDLKQLRDDTRRILEKTFPKSEYLTSGFKKNKNPWWKLW